MLLKFDFVAAKFLDARAYSAYDEAVYEWLSMVDLPEFPGIRYWFDDLDHDGDEHGDERPMSVRKIGQPEGLL